MEATPRPRAATPGQVSRRCSGGDSRRRYLRRSRPCQMRAPAPAAEVVARWCVDGVGAKEGLAVSAAACSGQPGL